MIYLVNAFLAITLLYPTTLTGKPALIFAENPVEIAFAHPVEITPAIFAENPVEIAFAHPVEITPAIPVVHVPRGVRNHNPGNIRCGNTQWQGLHPQHSDEDGFCLFISPHWGIRALTRTLHTYMTSHHLYTIVEITNRWAPAAGGNDTALYARVVSYLTGYGVDIRLSPTERVMKRLAAAIIHHENGQQPYDARTITAGVRAGCRCWQ